MGNSFINQSLKYQGNYFGGSGWAQFVSRSGTGTWDLRLAENGSQASTTIFFNWYDCFNTGVAFGGPINPLSTALGWATQVSDQNGKTTRLARQLPARHPLWPSLWAREITHVEGVQFNGKSDFGPGRGPFAQYSWAKVVIAYDLPPYSVLTDAQCQNQEWLRFTHKLFADGSSGLTTDRPAIVWNAGGGAGTPSGPLNTGFFYPIQRQKVTYRWYRVPYAGLFNSQGIPQNILSCMNHVNLNTFDGRPPGTLFMEAPGFSPVGAPVSPLLIGQGQNDQPLYYNVDVNMVYFDPAVAGVYPPFLGVGGYDGTFGTRGHNCSLFYDGKFYPAKWAVGGAPVFPATDFTTAFQMNTN